MESTYQKHLSDLNELAGLIGNGPEMNDMDTCDVDKIRNLIRQNEVYLKYNKKVLGIQSNDRNTLLMFLGFFLFKETETILQKEVKPKLEDVTFDIQCFISEHTQFLSPTQSSYLLKFLNTTQRAFRDRTERLVTQRSALDVLLNTRDRENQEKVCFAEKWNISDHFSTEQLCIQDYNTKFH